MSMQTNGLLGESIYASRANESQQMGTLKPSSSFTSTVHSPHYADISLKRSQTMRLPSSTQANSRSNSLNYSYRSSFLNNNYHRMMMMNDENELNENDEINDSILFTPSTSSSSSSSSPSAIYSNNQLLNVKSNNKKPGPPIIKMNTANETDGTNDVTMDSSSNNVSSTMRRGTSFRNNEALLSNILRNQTNKPTPPSRTSSLQYKPFQKPNMFANSMRTGTNANNSDDRHSIYSTYSLRMSNLNSLSSFSLANNNNTTTNGLLQHEIPTTVNLTDSDKYKIESCYQSIGSSVYAGSCLVELYSTNLESLIKLLDWKHVIGGVPVWIFNTGHNPKRPKGLSLVIADKKTGFALWALNNITFLNDVKWSKPGHITFKINANSKPNGQTGSSVSNSSKALKKKSSFRPMAKFRPLTSSLTAANLASTADSFSTMPTSVSAANLPYSQNGKMDKDNKTSQSLFMALRFYDEFECSKFYDFYRVLFVDSHNDDLFNPHYKPSSKTSIIKIFYKKITKNSISSPVAFNHVNSLSIVDEEKLNRSSSKLTINTTKQQQQQQQHQLAVSSSSSDTQSISSDLTVTSHNNSSSLITLKRNKH